MEMKLLEFVFGTKNPQLDGVVVFHLLKVLLKVYLSGFEGFIEQVDADTLFECCFEIAGYQSQGLMTVEHAAQLVGEDDTLAFELLQGSLMGEVGGLDSVALAPKGDIEANLDTTERACHEVFRGIAHTDSGKPLCTAEL